MRRAPAVGAALLAALSACRSPAPGGFTLLFLGRSPAAALGGSSWAPDPDNSRIVAFDHRLRVVRIVTGPRLSVPVAVAPLGADLLVTERTGEGDVLDTATGTILATRRLAPRETAVAVDARGSIAAFDADSLLRGASAAGREAFEPAFALPDLTGDTVTLARFAGKVTLVNFWASWCDPCREEFPHMTELYREFSRRAFEIAAISDDVDRGKMAAFVREFRPPFPILVGGGRMKQAYHYRGLPYSVLLDRQGRIIERIFGFGGAEEFRELHETIAKEVRAP
ncbi:MAG: hypothetical protein DMD36_15240 [Gemmatimonadetes bacterium]|nr:MAG: hypothetical protein DMD36_15240 [Gemmatimonadota bacterium]